MAAGKVVFDGRPEDLTRDAVSLIYGAEGALDESMTSTTINIPTEAAPSAAPEAVKPLVLLGV